VTENSHFIWLAGAYLAFLSLVVSVIDFRRLIIPNRLNAAIAGGGLVSATLLDTTSFVACFIGGVLGFTTLLALRTAYRRIRGHEGLGLGDVKFMGGAGLWVGWQGLAPMLLLSSLSALAFVAIRGMSRKSFNLRQELPFGPFLCIGMLATWIIQTVGYAPWIVP